MGNQFNIMIQGVQTCWVITNLIAREIINESSQSLFAFIVVNTNANHDTHKIVLQFKTVHKTKHRSHAIV